MYDIILSRPITIRRAKDTSYDHSVVYVSMLIRCAAVLHLYCAVTRNLPILNRYFFNTIIYLRIPIPNSYLNLHKSRSLCTMIIK